MANELIANIKTDVMLTSVLSNFESPFIIHMVQDSINMRFRPYNTALPSLNSIENNFATLLSGVESSEDITHINDVRISTYKEIIKTICDNFNISCNISEDTDVYSAAYWMYQFFVSDFTNRLFDFFVNYIVAEKTNLYNFLNLNDTRKDKDASTNYSKKLCTDTKLCLIHANIVNVLDSMVNFDINFDTLLRYSLMNESKEVTEFLSNIIVDNGNVYKSFFASLLLSNFRADIITNVKLRLQKYAITDMEVSNPINIIKGE